MSDSKVNVEIHPATQQYFEACEEDFPGLIDALIQDFRIYIASDREVLPLTFGCDVPYIHPHAAYEAGLMHIHICLPPHTFPEKVPQADRKCRFEEPERDAALVYVQGELFENEYRILAVLYPDAHTKGRDGKTIPYLARVAREFRDAN
ncbi:type II toxin-antitoxin system YafO family toxin [Halomonas sp.]|uniref:type II toxin-antitoxin system YafO family toxin n=1 Tax=Halomonas sp. TaxID=1486246 RepID=UPI00298D727B|nr:type II toxin-antitoxin system YafO family toxin [Halomonas sp.]MDW7747705.1 type II toxin-antitoxin system YafO family toxin [Halomonas sp.]